MSSTKCRAISASTVLCHDTWHGLDHRSCTTLRIREFVSEDDRYLDLDDSDEDPPEHHGRAICNSSDPSCLCMHACMPCYAGQLTGPMRHHEE